MFRYLILFVIGGRAIELARKQIIKKSSKSNGQPSFLRVATPQSRGLDFLREREILYPEGIEGGTRLIPLDLTSVSNQEIGHLHSEWAARLAYAIAVVGEVETQIAGCKAVLAKGGDKDQLQAEIRSLQVDFVPAFWRAQLCNRRSVSRLLQQQQLRKPIVLPIRCVDGRSLDWTRT